MFGSSRRRAASTATFLRRPPTSRWRGWGIALVDPVTAHYFEGALDAEVRPLKNAPFYDLALIAPPEQAHSRASVRLREMVIAAVENVVNSCARDQIGVFPAGP